MSNMNGGKFGVNMWWHVPACVIDSEMALGVVKANGFDEKMMPTPTDEREFKNGLDSVANKKCKNSKSTVEKVRDDNGKLVYGILDYGQEGIEEGVYRQHNKAWMDKDTGEIACEGAKSGEVLQAVQIYKGKITDDDIRSFLVNVVGKCHGVSKRHGGGIYFIPAQYVEKIEAAQKVLREIGSGAKIYVERVVDGEQERANVWEACESDIGQQIEKTLAAVGRIEKRASSVENKKAKLEELEEMMDVYKGLLGQEAKYEELAERIESAVKVVVEKMTQIQQGTAASVVAPKKVEKSEKAKVADGEDKISVVEAAIAVLTKAGRDMTAKEIFAEAQREGWYVSNSKDPYNSFSATMAKSLTRGETRLQRFSGMWHLAA